MRFYLFASIFLTIVLSHSIISTDYIEECDNAVCEYTNKIVLLLHPYDYNKMVIGYDNMTGSNIYFDLNSLYYLYDVNATQYRTYKFQYEYFYNCWNEIMNIPYAYTCNTTIIGDCKYYSNVFPFPTGDCMGLQKRFVEITSFVPMSEYVSCVVKSSIQARLSGTLEVGNDTTIFDSELEIGRLSTISNNVKITLLSDIQRSGLGDLCRITGDNKIIYDLIKGRDINDYISRRIINSHLITNFQEDLLPYEITDDLQINQKGIYNIDDSKYFFLYYLGAFINGTSLCKPLPYGDDYKMYSMDTIEIDGHGYPFFIDRNCTMSAKPLPTNNPSGCSNGFADAEDNVFCYDTNTLVLLSGKVVSSEIKEDVMIQISYKGEYKAKQVFYDKCRIREISYINNTIYLYDCDDPVYIKNKYTNRVYKVHNNMEILLPDGIYFLADYITSPLLYVINSVETPTMYYAKDKFYSNIVIGLGFSIDIIETKTSYILFYVIFSIIILIICLIVYATIHIIHKRWKYTKVPTDDSNKKPMKKKSMKQKVASKMSGK